MTIDWSKPIEAVHEDGRVKTLTFGTVSAYPGLDYGGYIPGVGNIGFDRDGKPGGRHALSGWLARNIVQPTSEQFAKNAKNPAPQPHQTAKRVVELPEVGSEAERALVERIEGAVRSAIFQYWGTILSGNESVLALAALREIGRGV
jgi:hypothetical protein